MSIRDFFSKTLKDLTNRRLVNGSVLEWEKTGTNLFLFHALAALGYWRECGCDGDDFGPPYPTDPFL